MTVPDRSEPNFSAFSYRDVADIGLQRTSHLLSLPWLGKVSFRYWKRQSTAALFMEARVRRRRILTGAFGDAEREFKRIESFLESRKPKSVVDIGCGHGLIDLLLYRSFTCSLHLVDVERTEERHHGFRRDGAGYASLDAAREFLTTNAVPPGCIRTTNPRLQELRDPGSDLVMSLLSCGFHYPVETYEDFVMQTLRPGGVFIFDCRKTVEDRRFLDRFSSWSVIDGGAKHERIAAIR